jgi:hypothetical protein
MHRRRVYVDNSVFGGVFDDEFAEASEMFFAEAKSGDWLLLISRIVFDEISLAPSEVQDVLRSLPEECLDILELTPDARALADAYVEAGVLGEASRNDALQVAVVSAHDVRLIASWNFRHLVNYDRIQGFNAVNLLKGYGPVDIRTPKELLHDDETL